MPSTRQARERKEPTTAFSTSSLLLFFIHTTAFFLTVASAHPTPPRCRLVYMRVKSTRNPLIKPSSRGRFAQIPGPVDDLRAGTCTLTVFSEGRFEGVFIFSVTSVRSKFSSNRRHKVWTLQPSGIYHDELFFLSGNTIQPQDYTSCLGMFAG